MFTEMLTSNVTVTTLAATAIIAIAPLYQTRDMDLLAGQKVVMKDCQTYNANYYLKKVKIIIYYFSASWVDDLVLLQQLKEIYAENVKRHIGMEVVYVSSDEDEKQFSKYFREHHGNWPSIAPKYSELAELIRYTYNITCLPQIVVVRKEDGFVISRRGKEELEKNGINVLVVWSDYEPDLTVVEDTLIELHYPMPQLVPISQDEGPSGLAPEDGEGVSAAEEGEHEEEGDEGDDKDDEIYELRQIQEKIMSISSTKRSKTSIKRKTF